MQLATDPALEELRHRLSAARLEAAEFSDAWKAARAELLAGCASAWERGTWERVLAGTRAAWEASRVQGRPS